MTSRTAAFPPLIIRTEGYEMKSHGRTGRPTGRPASAKAQSLATENVSTENREIPEPPEHFGEDEILMWIKLWSMKHIAESDWFAVKMCCEIYAEYEYLRRLFSTGQARRVVTHPNRVKGESPELKDLRTARIELNGAMSSLGLTPTDRARLQITENAAALALETMLRDRQRAREERRKVRAS